MKVERMASDIELIIATLNELLEDTTLPKSVQKTIREAIEIIQKGKDKVSLNRALSALEEAADSVNMQPEHRTALFNVVSMLETA